MFHNLKVVKLSPNIYITWELVTFKIKKLKPNSSSNSIELRAIFIRQNCKFGNLQVTIKRKLEIFKTASASLIGNMISLKQNLRKYQTEIHVNSLNIFRSISLFTGGGSLYPLHLKIMCAIWEKDQENRIEKIKYHIRSRMNRARGIIRALPIIPSNNVKDDKPLMFSGLR